MFQFGGLGALFGGLSPPKLPRGDGSRFRTGVIKLSLAMYPFSISIDVPPKISNDKKTVENNKNVFTNKHIMILKIILTDALYV